MEDETLKLARQVMDAIGERDLSRLSALTDPEVEWRSFFAALLPTGQYHGHDGLRTYVKDLDEAWEVVRGDVEQGVAVGDVALLVGRIHYRGRGSAVENESPAGWMLQFRQGRVVCFRAFMEPEQALAAVGLSE